MVVVVAGRAKAMGPEVLERYRGDVKVGGVCVVSDIEFVTCDHTVA